MKKNIWLICAAINIGIAVLHIYFIKVGAPAYVYGKINKKLNIGLSRDEIEKMIFSIIKKIDKSEFHKKGKNIYIIN